MTTKNTNYPYPSRYGIDPSLRYPPPGPVKRPQTQQATGGEKKITAVPQETKVTTKDNLGKYKSTLHFLMCNSKQQYCTC